MFGNLGINLQDYAASSQAAMNGGNYGGHGVSGQEELNQLQKALEAGNITGRETTNSTSASGSPLKVESLDSTLKLLTFKKSDIVVWQKVPKLKAYNTVEEFNQQESYGADRGGFILEGELPQEEDSVYVRRAQLVKFLGVVKSVSHVLTTVNTMVGNVINKEAQNGSLWILRKLNRSLVYGNSTVIPQEFNGFYHQHARHDGATYADGNLANYINSDVVIDMRGKRLTESAIEDAAETITTNFGIPTDLFATPKVISNYTKQEYGQKFIVPGQASQMANMGRTVKGQETNYGTINFNRDIFLRQPAAKSSGAAATHPKAPAAVTGLTGAVVASDAESKFAAVDAGDYIYAVAAVNRFGESALAELGAAVTVASGNSIDLTFTAGVGANPATGFAVYRTLKNGTGKFYKIYEISTGELANGHNGAGASNTRDRNFFLPKTDEAYIIQNDEEVCAFKQLLPMMKMDLAITSPAYRFMVLLYGTPMLYAPKKMVRFINIGEETA